MKKLLGLFFVAFVAIALVGCGKKEVEATGYGLVHKHYVAEVDVKVKGDKVLDVKFEEYYLPYHLGGLTNTFEGELPENVVNQGTEEKPNLYAKYMLIDGKLFTASKGEAGISYKNAEGKDIEVLVKDEAVAKKYVEDLKANKVFIVDSATATAKSTVLLSKQTKIDKTSANYWPEGGVGLGWKKNMAAMVEEFIKNGVDKTYTRDEETGIWSSADGATTATLSDFKDYQEVAKRAVANATK